MTLQNNQVSTSGFCEWHPSQCYQSDFSDVIKLRALVWLRGGELSRWVLSAITSVLKEGGGSDSKEGNELRCAGAHSEDGRRGHEPRHAALDTGKGQGTDSPSEPDKGGMWPCCHLDFSLAKFFSNLRSPEVLENKSIVFSYQVCSNLSQ